MGSLDFLLQDKRVIITIGAGGVGKTTCSIAFAIKAAKMGRRVGLLSIDPARRLADALGMSLCGDLRPIYQEEGLKLDAAMIDQKSVFDSMVSRFAKSPEEAKRIMEHRLYKTASSRLAGAVEYMALSKLNSMVDSKQYDLIVVDTPPDSHALDFLERPNILAGFKDNKVMAWLIKPFHMVSTFGLKKLLSVSEKLMGGIAKVAGFQTLSMLAEFLVLMQDVVEGFHNVGEGISTTLHSPTTGFVLVSAAQVAAMCSARDLHEKLHQLGFPIEGGVLNRTWSNELKADLSLAQAEIPNHEILKLLNAQISFEEVCLDELMLLLRRYVPSAKVATFPQHYEEIHSPQAMLQFSG